MDRADFDDEIRRRGGGVSSARVAESIAATADHFGAADFEVSLVSVSPLTDTVVMRVRDPLAPAQIDNVVLSGGDIWSVEPEQLSIGDNPADGMFAISRVAVDQLEDMALEALNTWGIAGYVDSIYISADDVAEGKPGRVVVVMDLESDRSTAQATFTGDGVLVGVVPT